MAITDLIFGLGSSTDVIYDHITITNEDDDPSRITVQNLGEDTLKNLGVYLTTPSDLGDVDNPSDNPPATCYQLLLDWGTAVEVGTLDEDGEIITEGGLILVYEDPATGTEKEIRFSRFNGSSYSNRIKLGTDGVKSDELKTEEYVSFQLKYESPPDIDASRVFINITLGAS